MIKTLTRVLVISIPLNILGFFIDEKLIVPSMIVLAVLAGVVLINLSGRSGVYRPRWAEDSWTFPFIAFFLVSIVSFLVSPFLQLAAVKGGIQIIGIGCAILSAFGVAKCYMRDAGGLIDLCRLIAITMAMVSLIGLLQFVCWNILGLTDVLTFEFMNQLYGKTLWRDPGKIGDIARVNSILAEPAYMTRVLGLGCGLALVRLGLAGRRFRDGLRDVVPLWSAVSIVVCYAVSTSLLGYIHILLVILSMRLISSEINIRTSIRYAVFVLVTISLAVAFVINLNTDFEEKIESIALIVNTDESDRNADYREKTQSALAVAVNLDLAVENVLLHPFFGVGVGGHPISYYSAMPEVNENVFGLNVDDAASLGLRLMSETGLVGLATFLIGVSYLAMGVTIARGARELEQNLQGATLNAVAVALVSSWIGLSTIYLLRTGLYFDATFWLMVGLVASLRYSRRDQCGMKTANA